MRVYVRLALLVAVALALGVISGSWVQGTKPSGAQAGTMYGCPPLDGWAISVWDGPDGTGAGEALETCGEGAVAVAYYLDPVTQIWSRWIAGQPLLSNLMTLNNLTGVFTAGSAAARASSSRQPLGPAAQAGMHNCPLPNKWAISVWDGPNGTDADEALGTCGDVAYYLDPVDQAWLRWFRDFPAFSNLVTVDNMMGMMMLSGTPICTPVFPGTYNGSVAVNGEAAPDGTIITASIEGVIWGTAATTGGRYVLDVPDRATVAACFPYGQLEFSCDDLLATQTTDWSPGLHDLDITCDSPDTDGDTIPDSLDPDDDDDTFDDGVETYLGTDPLDTCPDDTSDDAWPLDVSKDTFITVAGDVFYFRGRIGETGGPPPSGNWRVRLDFNMDNFLTVAGDVFMYRGRIGERCT